MLIKLSSLDEKHTLLYYNRYNMMFNRTIKEKRRETKDKGQNFVRICIPR